MSWKRLLLIGTLIAVGLAGPIAILVERELIKLEPEKGSNVPPSVPTGGKGGYVTTGLDITLGDCSYKIVRRGDGRPVIDLSCEDHSTVDSELAKLVGGSAAFNAPDHATIGKSQVVEARLSISKSPSQLMSELPGSGRKESASLKVGDKMSATLNGGGAFDISPSGPQVQLISSKDTTVWEWTINPKIAGTHFLILSFDAFITVDGKEGTRTINTLIKTIDVQVAWPETLQDWLDYVKKLFEGVNGLWATMLVPVGAYIIHIWKKTGNPKKADATAPSKAASLGPRRARKSRG
jgi:hypothetical protein